MRNLAELSPVTVVIASLNEEGSIAASVHSALAAGAAEVIVADGGSSDATREIAQAEGARVIECEAMRARQLNRGAAAATGRHVIFLHADTVLPGGAAAAVASALEDGADFGGFRLRFIERGIKLRIAERLINARTRITRCPWGDQAQFIERTRFVRDGGFLEIPLMEDYEMALRMRRCGRSVLLPFTVGTSGRRFLENGALATVVTNWRIVAAYRLGAAPERLAEIYRGAKS